jgi:hypothetical protein
MVLNWYHTFGFQEKRGLVDHVNVRALHSQARDGDNGQSGDGLRARN